MSDRRSDEMSESSDADLDEMLGAYSLNAVSKTERDAIDAYLDRSPLARAEVRQHVEVATAMGNSPGEAPAALWRAIEQRLDERAPIAPDADVMLLDLRHQASTRDDAVTPIAQARGFARFRGIERAVAAAAAVVIGLLGITIKHQSNRIDRISAAGERTARLAADEAKRADRLQVELANTDPLKRHLQSLIADPTTTSVTLDDASGAPIARVILARTGEGFVLGEQLPTLPSDHTYQLWGVRGKTVLSLGILGPHPSEAAFAGNGGWDSFVLTKETTPGVASSNQKAFAVGAVLST